MHQYETTFVIDSLLKKDEIDEIVKRYERFISANGGIIIEIQHWGKKRLAYEIRKRQYGYFVYTRFEGPGSVIKPLEREFVLNESILRFLTIVLTKQALKAETIRKQRQKLAQETKQNLELEEAATSKDLNAEKSEVAVSTTEEVTAETAAGEAEITEKVEPQTQEENAAIPDEAQEEAQQEEDKKTEGDIPKENFESNDNIETGKVE